MKATRGKPVKTLRIVSDFFVVKYADQEPLRYRMRLDYNDRDGVQLFINRRGSDYWEVHSSPYPGALPAPDLKQFVTLFKRSVRKFNPKAKFKQAK